MTRNSQHPKSTKLSRSLQQKLNSYAMAASAAGLSVLALTTGARAEIVFTPHRAKLTEGQFAVDFNQDGIPEFLILDKSLYKASTFCSFCVQYLKVTGNGNVGAAAVGVAGETAALLPGAIICAHDPFENAQSAGVLMASAFNDDNSFFLIYGQFSNTKKRFLGLKFQINGQTHYGWVRLAAVKAGFGNAPYVVAVIDGYAYETTPNQAIVDGMAHGTSGANDESVIESPASRQPTLGLLAVGAQGVPVWRGK